jgi:Domain of unknown function (DUF3883)
MDWINVEARIDYILIGDKPVATGHVREALVWLDGHMDSGHGTFTTGMKGLKNPLSKWSAGRMYQDLKYGANRSEIRSFLWGKLAEFEALTAIELAGAVGAGGGQGFAIDQKEKVAVEQRAMAAAREYYEGTGWYEDKSQKDAHKYHPFDLALNKDGQVMHVEVKGTRQKFVGVAEPEITVFLTANEVAHARDCGAAVPCHSTELFILTDVEIETNQTGEKFGVGGIPHPRDFSKLSDPYRLQAFAFRYIA